MKTLPNYQRLPLRQYHPRKKAKTPAREMAAAMLVLIAIASLTSCVTSTTTRIDPDGTRTVTVTQGPDADTVAAVAGAATSYVIHADK